MSGHAWSRVLDEWFSLPSEAEYMDMVWSPLPALWLLITAVIWSLSRYITH